MSRKFWWAGALTGVVCLAGVAAWLALRVRGSGAGCGGDHSVLTASSTGGTRSAEDGGLGGSKPAASSGGRPSGAAPSSAAGGGRVQRVEARKPNVAHGAAPPVAEVVILPEEQGTSVARAKELRRAALAGRYDFAAAVELFAQTVHGSHGGGKIGEQRDRVAQLLYETGQQAGFAAAEAAGGDVERARAGFAKFLTQSRSERVGGGAADEGAGRAYWGAVLSHLVGQTGGALAPEAVLEYARAYEAAFAVQDCESQLCLELLDAHPDSEAVRKLGWLNRALACASSDEQRAKTVEAGFAAGVQKEQVEPARALARAALGQVRDPAAKARIERWAHTVAPQGGMR